jgi:hypothetical protein
MKYNVSTSKKPTKNVPGTYTVGLIEIFRKAESVHTHTEQWKQIYNEILLDFN